MAQTGPPSSRLANGGLHSSSGTAGQTLCISTSVAAQHPDDSPQADAKTPGRPGAEGEGDPAKNYTSSPLPPPHSEAQKGPS